MITTLEKSIRENFPGKNNAGLRAELRSAGGDASVMHAIGRRTGLTASGKASLDAVIAVAELCRHEPVGQ